MCVCMCAWEREGGKNENHGIKCVSCSDLLSVSVQTKKCKSKTVEIYL